MSIMNIALTNLGKYNEGELVYKWLELPATEAEIAEALEEIGISDEPDEEGRYYEEYFITDYECDFLRIGEYDNIDELNEIAEQLDGLADYEQKIVEALLADGFELEEAINKIDDCYYYDNCDTMGDVAYRMYEEGLFGATLPEWAGNYFDWDAYGRDLEYYGHWIATDTGYIEVVY